MTRCGESGPHGHHDWHASMYLKAFASDQQELSQHPKPIFWGFSVQASVKVLFLTRFFDDATSITIACH
jgi:hypothetical protein